VTDKVKEAVTSAMSSAPSGQDGGNNDKEAEGREATGASRPHIGQETSGSYVAGLPVVSFRFSDEFKKEYPHLKQETVSMMLRAKQWIIPNYALPPKEDATEILRVVVRENMSFELLDKLISDIVSVTETLMEDDQIDLSILQKQKRPLPDERKKPQDVGKKGDTGKKSVEARVGENAKRMADGIHRSVC
jgi:glutamate decarboxylase